MMEFINDVSTESVFELIKQTYKTETGKDLQIGSDEFAIATVVAYIFGVLVQKFNAQAKQRYLATATGDYLNALGETFDIERPAPVHASCLVSVVTSAAVTLTAGEFLIADDNGIQFTPSETTALEAGGGTVLFVGYGNDNVLDENNIEIGAITEIVTPMAEVESVSNIGVTGGAKDEFPDTDAGDEAYRAYIIEKRSGVSVGGPATAYEQRAKSADGRVVDAYCLRYTDGSFVPGTAHVYEIIINDEYYDELSNINTVPSKEIIPSSFIFKKPNERVVAVPPTHHQDKPQPTPMNDTQTVSSEHEELFGYSQFVYFIKENEEITDHIETKYLEELTKFKEQVTKMKEDNLRLKMMLKKHAQNEKSLKKKQQTAGYRAA